MKTQELLTLSQFVDLQEKSYPKVFTKSEMNQLVIDKYKAISMYNQFLKQKLTIDMFEGENRIFNGGKYVDVQPSNRWNYYRFGDKTIFQDGNGTKNMSLGFTIADLAGRGNLFITK